MVVSPVATTPQQQCPAWWGRSTFSPSEHHYKREVLEADFRTPGAADKVNYYSLCDEFLIHGCFIFDKRASEKLYMFEVTATQSQWDQLDKLYGC